MRLKRVLYEVMRLFLCTSDESRDKKVPNLVLMNSGLPFFKKNEYFLSINHQFSLKFVSLRRCEVTSSNNSIGSSLGGALLYSCHSWETFLVG